MKRLLDIILVLIGAPLWLPLMLIVACLVRLKLGAPVFFTQERAGLNGKPFRMIKFRSMRNGPGTDEERLTKFGRFLRAASLDELPELLLVLRGTLSLVGPRPLPTIYLPRYSPEQARRHDVRPGITGWAQVNGLRGDTSIRARVDYDLYYIENWSMLFDLKILLMTPFKGVVNRQESLK